MPDQTLFFYGSLRDAAVLALVLGRPAAPRPAFLPNHRAMRVVGEAFPMAVHSPGDRLEGVLVTVTPEELARIRFFEDDAEFDLTEIEVQTDAHAETAAMFASALTASDTPWDYADWRHNERPFLLECAHEIMALYDRGADWSDLTLWPGIKARAHARVNAASEPSRKGVANLPRDRVETLRTDRPYASFFAIEEHHIRHPRFDGAQTPVLKRAVFASGDAVTVVPYDPVRDTVLLVTQWRAAPHARGDSDPWPVEAVAGRIDAHETPEATARREALEEAGLTLGRMRKIAAYYPSPGAVAEFVTAFVGEATLPDTGAAHGLETEDEDILSLILLFDEALEMVENFEANTSPVLITLLWLARHRDALRREWL